MHLERPVEADLAVQPIAYDMFEGPAQPVPVEEGCPQAHRRTGQKNPGKATWQGYWHSDRIAELSTLLIHSRQ